MINFNQEIVFDFINRGISDNRNNAHNRPITNLSAKKLLCMAINHEFKRKSFEESLKYYQFLSHKVAHIPIERILESYEELILGLLEKEIELDSSIKKLFEKFFFERPDCLRYEQVAVEYEKPKWRKRKEAYYKAIDIIIKKISEARDGHRLRRFWRIFGIGGRNFHPGVTDSLLSWLLRDLSALQTGNFIDLTKLSRNDFIPFRPEKEDFVTVKTLELSDLAHITKRSQIKLDEEVWTTIFRDTNREDFQTFRITARDSFSYVQTIDRRRDYEEDEGGFDGFNQNRNDNLNTNVLNFKQTLSTPGNLTLGVKTNCTDFKPYSFSLRAGLSYLSPSKEMLRNQNYNNRRDPWQRPFSLPGNQSNKKFELKSPLASLKGLPETHQVVKKKVEMKEEWRNNINRGFRGFYSTSDYETGLQYYGVYNRRFKKVLLSPDHLIKKNYISPRRAEFENQGDGSAMIHADEVGTYDEIFEDLVVFSNLVKLTGANTGTGFYKMLERRKAIRLTPTPHIASCASI